MKFDPDYNCHLCPRIWNYRNQNHTKYPNWHNGPVNTWFSEQNLSNIKFLIIGMAPGLKGANRTGKPFIGDYAGVLLYQTLIKFGYASGNYNLQSNDILSLHNTAITNAVRCAPPKNKLIRTEINNCQQFLANTILRFKKLRVILTLGKVAHDSTMRTLGITLARVPFSHNKCYEVNDYMVFSSYHCSRYNTNTGRLTTTMFEEVFSKIHSCINNL